ncbi:MAG: coenzyme F420-0:L-glutamate ligase [Candidatus Kerfeldbacteria bacterium]|nr:coenzyme F420-0:L-glutamate ligase [Candidatus Kerfeldbacteria bacterium]
MRVVPVRLSVRIEPGTDVSALLTRALARRPLRSRIVVVSSKVVAYDQRRVVRLADVRPTTAGRRLARRFRMSPAFATLIHADATRIAGGVPGAILTDVRGQFTVNAGIDASNAPAGMVIRWPASPWRWAADLHRRLETIHRGPIGVIVADSRCLPGRLGTTGVALAIAGFHGVHDVRGQHDLYGHPLRLTRMNVADDLAAAAHLVQGEADERTPLCILTGAPVRFTHIPAVRLTRALQIAPRSDLFASLHATRVR